MSISQEIKDAAENIISHINGVQNGAVIAASIVKGAGAVNPWKVGKVDSCTGSPFGGPVNAVIERPIEDGRKRLVVARVCGKVSVSVWTARDAKGVSQNLTFSIPECQGVLGEALDWFLQAQAEFRKLRDAAINSSACSELIGELHRADMAEHGQPCRGCCAEDPVVVADDDDGDNESFVKAVVNSRAKVTGKKPAKRRK